MAVYPQTAKIHWSISIPPPHSLILVFSNSLVDCLGGRLKTKKLQLQKNPISSGSLVLKHLMNCAGVRLLGIANKSYPQPLRQSSKSRTMLTSLDFCIRLLKTQENHRFHSVVFIVPLSTVKIFKLSGSLCKWSKLVVVIKV